MSCANITNITTTTVKDFNHRGVINATSKSEASNLFFKKCAFHNRWYI